VRGEVGGPPLLVAVTGTDGSGKTTVTRNVFNELPALLPGVALNDRWDIVGNPTAYPTARFLADDIPLLRNCITNMSPLSRLLFLLWTMHLSLADRVGEAENVLLSDSYWMKHAAVEVVYGLDPDWTSTVCSGLPRADLVLYLRVSPELAWRRIGASVNPYECGMDPSCSEAAFLRHQHAVREVLDDWARAGNWTVVDADEPLAGVHEQVVAALEKAIAVGGGAHRG
jgi:dTMP kinase